MFLNFYFFISNLVNTDRNYAYKQKFFDVFNNFLVLRDLGSQSLRAADPNSHYYTAEA